MNMFYFAFFLVQIISVFCSEVDKSKNKDFHLNILKHKISASHVSRMEIIGIGLKLTLSVLYIVSFSHIIHRGARTYLDLSATGVLLFCLQLFFEVPLFSFPFYHRLV